MWASAGAGGTVSSSVTCLEGRSNAQREALPITSRLTSIVSPRSRVAGPRGRIPV